jgi:hypothetical protein
MLDERTVFFQILGAETYLTDIPQNPEPKRRSINDAVLHQPVIFEANVVVSLQESPCFKGNELLGKP